MPAISCLSARGGTGCSLITTNMAVAFAQVSSTLLLDLNPGNGCDDLLLNLQRRRSWVDLLPVANEVTSHQLELVCVEHPSTLYLLPSPHSYLAGTMSDRIEDLLKSLLSYFNWVFLDMPTGFSDLTRRIIRLTDIVILISTPDPPALRATKAIIEEEAEIIKKGYLILNQYSRGHPSQPIHLAKALGIELMAVLPPDPLAVSYQIGFGDVCVEDRRSPFGQAIRKTSEGLLKKVLGSGMRTG